MPDRVLHWELAADHGACRLCGSTTSQRHFWQEVYADSGQQLRRCGHCAGVYLAPGFTESGLQRFYAHHYRKLFPAEVPWRNISRFFGWRGDREIARQRLAMITPDLACGSALFEMGSGFGAFLGQAADMRPDLLLSASEPDHSHREALLGKAAVLFVEGLDNVTTGSLDAVVAFHVLEHLIDPAGFLEQAARALRANGRLWIEVPDLMNDWQTRLFVHPAHLSYFCATSLQGLTEAAGLQVVYCGPHPLPAMAGTLWLEARRPEHLHPAPVKAAENEIVMTVDHWIERVGWHWKDRAKALLKRALLGLLGGGLIGELQRWRHHRARSAAGPRT